MADITDQDSIDDTRVKSADPSQVDSEDSADAAEEKENEEILRRAKDCLQLAEDAEQEIRKLALEDIEFSIGQQWPDTIQQDRNRDGRPCLVINRMPGVINQITNDQRQNRPAIKVHPVGDGADEETAKIFQGIVRHIEYNSNADIAYDTGFDFAVRGGFGYWRVLPEYVSGDSFDQELIIKRIRNNFSVYLDPNHQEPDGSDANWGLILEWLQKDEYKSKYPDADLNSLDWNQTGNDIPSWMRDGSTLVAEYFYKEYEDETLHLLNTGETVLDRDVAQKSQDAMNAGIQLSIVKSRTTKIQKIKWVKIDAVEVLEKTDWPGKYIPIVPVYGNDVYVNGKRHLEGIVRNAKDPQRMVNYWASAETEAIALAPKAPFIGAEGQFEGYEEIWKTANRKNHAFLPYKPTTIAGQMAPPPQRQSAEPAVQAITNARMIAADDLKATTGIYDASLGAGPGDTSGIAIQRRNNQSQTSNFHFVDNLARSIKHTGRMLVDLIPHYYDAPRAIRIIDEDGGANTVQINQVFNDESGKQVHYKTDVGTYGVTIDVGPSYASKRQEAVASMQSIAQSYPKILEAAGDIFVGSMDWPRAQDIADRLKKLLPPGLADDPNKGPQKLPPQVQAQMQQMGQVIQALTSELNQATDAIKTEKYRLESRERMEMAKIQADVEINLAKLGSQSSIELLRHEMDSISNRLKLLGFDQPMGAQQNIQQNFQPPAPGAQSAVGPGGSNTPTGGSSPGQPMGQ